MARGMGQMHLICLTRNNGTLKGTGAAFKSKILHLMNVFQPCSQKLHTHKMIIFVWPTVENVCACLCQRGMVQCFGNPRPYQPPGPIQNLLNGIKVHLKPIFCTPQNQRNKSYEAFSFVFMTPCFYFVVVVYLILFALTLSTQNTLGTHGLWIMILIDFYFKIFFW